ncbi:CDP-alcohol phosphatidyltransferase family protein [Candidatus Babeliales bacterium]|nr:CDP-alcohol phosphatidyltransferase family protein [Candidatus Babeliales bacterium]MBP9843839.1 CDP-alcohol phosphatidyltransferase family protein [Candidatus Babeliales bacterium]
MLTIINVSTWFTFSRIFLAPCIMVAIYRHAWILAAILFGCAAMTDFFDGYYARLYNQETNFGRLLDPVADKVLLFSTLCALYQVSGQSLIPFWFIALVIGKDIILVCGAIFLLLQKKQIVIAPSIISKWITALFMLFLIYLMLVYSGFVSCNYIDQLVYFFAFATVIILFDYVDRSFKSL